MKKNLSLELAGLMMLGVLSIGVSLPAMRAQAPVAAVKAAPLPGILNREQAGAILPSSVFFREQSASIQARNSAGVRLADGKLMLATIVDTSGYSSGVAETYQAYLITEFPLRLGNKVLAPGAYGFGFVAGNRMVVMDVGGAEILHATTSPDPALKRPTPLQILAEGAKYRLYLGRNFISFEAAPAPGR